MLALHRLIQGASEFKDVQLTELQISRPGHPVYGPDRSRFDACLAHFQHDPAHNGVAGPNLGSDPTKWHRAHCCHSVDLMFKRCGRDRNGIPLFAFRTA